VIQHRSLGLIDSHAHIQGKEYTGEAEAVIQRAVKQALSKL
jgi:Tat protein secretion system quality control protein TatD with DNase activity